MSSFLTKFERENIKKNCKQNNKSVDKKTTTHKKLQKEEIF